MTPFPCVCFPPVLPTNTVTPPPPPYTSQEIAALESEGRALADAIAVLEAENTALRANSVSQSAALERRQNESRSLSAEEKRDMGTRS